MLKIRLQRAGRKRMPVYRIVVAEHSMPIQGRFKEKLGSFVSGKKTETLNINVERVKYWISVGAQPSQTMARLLVDQGIKEAQKFIAARTQKPKKETPKPEVKKDTQTETADQTPDVSEEVTEKENKEEENTKD